VAGPEELHDAAFEGPAGRLGHPERRGHHLGQGVGVACSGQLSQPRPVGWC
jgi:hypothetical protein